jgi:soluble lytic murein transglycosylase
MLGMGLFFALPPRTVHHDPAVSSVTSLAPDYISARDRTLYQSILALQEHGDYAAVDAMLPRLDNKILVGHVLAQRYLDGRYPGSREQLLSWLATYGDHPQAERIRQLAAQRGADPRVLASLETGSESLRGNGAIEQIGRAPMPDGWYRALSLWKEGQFGPAGALFTKVGDNESLSGWQRAAGYYWAFRSESRAGNIHEAANDLKKASDYPTTFYGLLAMRQRGQSLDLAAKAPRVPTAVYDDAHAVRARALAAIGQLELAEKELRNLYGRLDDDDKPAVISLAAQLNLANLQVRLAQMRGLSRGEAIFAAYPMPAWLASAAKPVADPALVMAIARQESVFREEVTSQAGAVGMMQMLPSTARHVLTGLPENALASIDDESAPMAVRLTKPELNIRLGAEYVRQLTALPVVDGNLVKLLAAYNAGPGSVVAWQQTARNIDDPLLYLESIPYAETRNYVMQVMAHYWVYQSLTGGHSASLAAMTRGKWPLISQQG